MAVSLAQLSSMLDPGHAAKMQYLQAKLQGEHVLLEQRAQIEYDKMHNARQIERDRQAYEEARKQRQLETSRVIEGDKHAYRLAELEKELEHHLKKMDADFHFQKLGRLDAMQQEIFSSTVRQLEQRSQLRSAVFQNLASAIINEKLAQKQHRRDLEKIQLQHEQQKDGRIFDQLCNYIFALLQSNQEQAAKDYIDRLVAEWSGA